MTSVQISQRTTSSREIRWLATQVKPFVRLHLGSYCGIVIAAILVILDPLIVRFLIDDVIPRRQVILLPIVGLAFLLTYAGRLGAENLSSLLSFRAVQKMSYRMRLSLLRNLQRLSAEYHENRPVGDTLHRLQIDVDQVGLLSGEILPSALRLTTVFTFVLIAMLLMNYQLTAMVIPLIPVFLLVRWRFHYRLRYVSDVVQRESGKMITFLEEHLSAIVQVQMLSCEQREARRFAGLSGSSVRAQITRRRVELLFSSFLYLIIVTGMAGVLCYGGYQVMTGALTPGGLVAFYGFTLQLFIPLYGVVDIYSKLQRVGASIRRLMEITDADLILRDRPGALNLEQNMSGEVELKSVSFTYQHDRPVLKRTSLRIKPGERVALAGASGNGKTTIARLVARLYDARAGKVLVDGIDVKDIKLKSLRSTVVLVPQEPVLFDSTLRQNLLYANAKATQSELDSIAELAQLEGLLSRLPQGWDEPLGPRGNRLSGGERQRVALARALLQHPRVLILDECTSALDALTEQWLFHRLDRHLRGVTTIVISHRPYPLEWADRVIVINGGEAGE